MRTSGFVAVGKLRRRTGAHVLQHVESRKNGRTAGAMRW